MNKYMYIMRFDHWIKQFFIVPGCLFAFLLTGINFTFDLLVHFFIGFFATCFIASANYVINEYLDAEFDRYHPVKKNRTAVTEGLKVKIVLILWIVLSACGFFIGYCVNKNFLCMAIFLSIMGILYNLKPIRTKDIPYLDVLSESINNAIRLLMGWFIISVNTLPPISIILGYWMGGAFLMAIKRFAEYRMIGNPELAGSYRKSFKLYTEKSLIISAFFYAMSSIFFSGIFLIKYKIELIIFIPALMGLFCYYFFLSFKEDSAVQRPEKLFHEKILMLYCLLLALLFIMLMFVKLPLLEVFIRNTLIQIK